MSREYHLEEEFYKNQEDLSVFPKAKDYITIYKQFKERFKPIHKEINSKLVELEKEGYFNDHGVNHIDTVIVKVSEMLSNMENNEITPYEMFILLMSIQLHDTGHLLSSRLEHAKKGKEILRNFDKDNVLSAPEKVHIGNIAKAHGGKEDPIGKLEFSCHLTNQKIRPQFLAALLRLGDELAEEKERASNFLIELNEKRENGEMPVLAPNSEIFHLFSASIDSCKFEGNEILIELYPVDYRLTKKYPVKKKTEIIERYLLDEMYDRTFKTFTESLYCNRFLPEECRVIVVKVNIYIITDKEQDVIKKISYELKETGYPLLEDKDIFERCVALQEAGQNITGEFINDFILKRAKE